MPVGKILGRVNSIIFQQEESDIMTDQNIYDFCNTRLGHREGGDIRFYAPAAIRTGLEKDF